MHLNLRRLSARVQHIVETNEDEARMTTYLWFVLLWIINGRLLTDRTNYIHRVEITLDIKRAMHKQHSNASDSSHDFSVKLSLFLCSHSSCLLRLAPTMFYMTSSMT